MIVRHRKLEILEWPQSPQGPKRATRPAGSQARSSPGIHLVGLIGTILIHAIVFQSFLLGSRAAKFRPPDTQGAGSTRVESDILPSETLILVDIPEVTKDDRPLDLDLASAGSVSRGAFDFAGAPGRPARNRR